MVKHVMFYLLAMLQVIPVVAQQDKNLKLWYLAPAEVTTAVEKNPWKDDTSWLKALPLGNGYIGAMVFGGVGRERIQLNEKTLWSGSHDDSDNPDAFNYLDSIRQLLFSGKYKEATALTEKTQVCRGAGTGHGSGANVPFGSFQTLGDLWLDFDTAKQFTHYQRELNLNTAIASVTYEQEGVVFKREIFISYPANVLAIHITASRPGRISFSCALNRPERFATRSEQGELVMNGQLDNGKGGGGMEYMARVKAVLKGGRQYARAQRLYIENADEATIVLSAATSYLPLYPSYTGNDYAKITANAVRAAASQSYRQLRDAHVNDYQKYFSRVTLQLADAGFKDTLPTDKRLQRFRKDPSDNYLQQLYFQFGRYLLIASSRENTLPANLQGIWSDDIQTPWNGDYHTNINLQMNYWPAETTNLSDLTPQLVKFISNLQQPGARTAAVQYHSPGWCVHSITNVWGYTSPGEHPGWGLHPAAGGWLCRHLWEHFLFTADTAYLANVFPVLKSMAVFYSHWLVKDPQTGSWVSGPASSPENSFVAPDSTVAQISMGPSHDQEIIYDLFSSTVNAADLLHHNDDTIAGIRAKLDRLKMPAIGKDGRLMEWAYPFEEVEPGHRHLSHLYLLYPGSKYDLRNDPSFAAAARKSLEFRLAHDGGHAGWSAAWVINLWARLHEGDKALQMLQKLLSKDTAPDLFDILPPFQIDGNFGATAGIAEMLLQSHNGTIELLPALPAAWKNGTVKGLKARGNYTIDMQWSNNRLTKAKIVAASGGNCTVVYKGIEKKINARKNGSYIINF